MGKVAARRTNSSRNRCAGKFSLFEDRSGASEQLTISAVQATLTCKKLRRRLRAVDEAVSDSGRAHGRGSLEAGRGSPSFNPRYRPKAGRSKQNPDGMPVVAMALQIRPLAGRRRRCWAAAMEMPSAARHRALRRPQGRAFTGGEDRGGSCFEGRQGYASSGDARGAQESALLVHGGEGQEAVRVAC